MANEILVQFLIAAVQLLVGLLLSMGSVYISLKMFDKFTYNLDEWKEMKKGNAAVGIFFGSIILSIAIIVESGVSALTKAIVPGMDFTVLLIAFTLGLLNLLISIAASIISIYVAIRVLDWITTDIDEMAELRKGNVAIAIIMATVLIAVSFVIRGAVSSTTQIVSAVEIFRLMGL